MMDKPVQGRSHGAFNRIPLATYRLQLRSDFTLSDAAGIVDYLDDLGVTDLYISPIFTAQTGSAHGYDVVDHGCVSPALGGEEALENLAARLKERGMGLILDMVPNHMGIGDESNRMWWDVLENGPSSPFAGFFDIDWNPPKMDLENQVHLPVLGDQYGLVLEKGELKLDYREGSFVVRYYDRVFPIAPRSANHILTLLLEKVRAGLPPENEAVMELESIITHHRNLPLRTETDPERIRERQREKEVARRRLQTLVAERPEITAMLDETILAMNGRPGDPRSFDALDALLNDQAYRLCYWRVAADEINYRRFFDVNELAAVRVEAPEVFTAVHDLALRLAGRGIVTGLRIDHIDGLHDPQRYLDDLQEGYRSASGRDEDLYVVVEKILGAREALHSAWRTGGTVGYDFLNRVNGLFVRRENAAAFVDLYRRLAGVSSSFTEVAHASKKFILLIALTSETHVLARKLDRISEQHRWSRDFTASSLKFALREVIAAFPVYRSYMRDGAVDPEDRRLVETAIREAKRRNPATSPSLFDFIASVLLAEDPPGLTDADRALRRDLVMRFQQLTAPVMAKGIEDTAFYRWYPLASLNEVGGDPARFGISTQEFHERNLERLNDWPHALLSTSTHDTKRGEDTRSRLDVLSEIPEAWARAVSRWREMNRGHRTEIDGEETPNANEEYLIYQTLVGTWPFEGLSDATRPDYESRIARYMEKAFREAKQRTSWINPNEPHDEAVRGFIRALLAPAPRGSGAGFLRDFATFVRPIQRAGAWNSLAQIVLKTASPGVPDFYQGCEFWDLSLVDPDNRRPVDFTARREAMRRVDAVLASGDFAPLAEQPENGHLKLLVTRQALALRRRNRELFESGEYEGLSARGEHADRVVAFARCRGAKSVIAVVGRFWLTSPGGAAYDEVTGDVWENTSLVLPAALAGRYRNALTGEHLSIGVPEGVRWSPRAVLKRLARRWSPAGAGTAVACPLDEVFDRFPVALWERVGA